VRLAIFGGSFDPPHVGHLLAASDAFELLRLDRLLFVPAAVQPFKRHEVDASAAQRLNMGERMNPVHPRFDADTEEIDREGLSYTVDTLDVLAAREPGARRFLLIGEDLAGEIATWRDASRIAELAEVVVLARTSQPSDDGNAPARVPLTRIATRHIEISSTEIRERVLAGKSIHGFVTEAVAGFIEAAGLYRHRGPKC
jgi:nicotinate-nucleotide adenylyltransferase